MFHHKLSKRNNLNEMKPKYETKWNRETERPWDRERQRPRDRQTDRDLDNVRWLTRRVLFYALVRPLSFSSQQRWESCDDSLPGFPAEDDSAYTQNISNARKMSYKNRNHSLHDQTSTNSSVKSLFWWSRRYLHHYTDTSLNGSATGEAVKQTEMDPSLILWEWEGSKAD